MGFDDLAFEARQKSNLGQTILTSQLHILRRPEEAIGIIENSAFDIV